jgi:hypothetical protein
VRSRPPVAAALGAVETDAVQPALVTVPNVELLEVGDGWETSTGTFTFTADDLVSCIASQEDPALRTPVLKLGHVDPRFDGQPSFGRIENLRLTNNNQTLVGDFVGVPLWLAKGLYTAYPRRSIEGNFDVETRTGNTWDMILTGVALLGDAYPAIDTLEDIQALWGAEPPPLYPVEDVLEIAAAGSFFRARKVDDMPNWLNRRENVEAAAGAVKASVGMDNIRNEFYEGLAPEQAWWWVREMRASPLSLIVDDDMGGLYDIPISVDGEDMITFGEPQAVKMQYVAATGMPVFAGKAGQVIVASYATPEQAGRNPRPAEEGDATLASSSNTDRTEENILLTPEELAALGLAPDANREQISAAILGQTTQEGEPDPDATLASETETPAAEEDVAPVVPITPVADEATPQLQVPEGMVLVDAATLAEMRTGVAAATGLVERQDRADRDAILDGAIRAGRFPKGRRAHYEALLSADPVGSKALILTLEPGIVPVAEVGEQGNEVAAAAADQTAYPAGWQRADDAGRSSLGDRIKVVQD